MQQADGVELGVVGTERVGADQLRQVAGLVGGSGPLRPHLVQDDRRPGLGGLPGGFRTGKAPADDMDGLHAA